MVKLYRMAFLLVCCLVWGLSLRAMATGSKIAGTWKSTTGATISVPNTPNDFDLIYHHPDGKKSLYQGHWVHGMVGLQFWFADENGTHVNCSYNPGRDQVRVDWGGHAKPGWWRRLR